MDLHLRVGFFNSSATAKVKFFSQFLVNELLKRSKEVGSGVMVSSVDMNI